MTLTVGAARPSPSKTRALPRNGRCADLTAASRVLGLFDRIVVNSELAPLRLCEELSRRIFHPSRNENLHRAETVYRDGVGRTERFTAHLRRMPLASRNARIWLSAN